MSNEKITCIDLNENGLITNLSVGLNQTQNSICVEKTPDLADAQIGDTLTGDIVPRDTEMGRAYGLRTILKPKLVKRPLTPAELRQKWYMEKYNLENEIKDIKFEIIYCTSRVQMAVMLGDNVSKDKELAKYQVLQAKETDLENRLAELIANEPQG